MADQLVRDAMVPEPLALDASASAQEAGEALARPDVRAVFVCAGGVLAGVVTRKTLVREVVARGLDPRTTPLGSIAEPPNATIESSMLLADAFAFLEEHDYERVPVVEGGRLVGIVTRHDLVRAFARADEEIWQEIDADPLIRSYWRRPTAYDVDVDHGRVTLSGKVDTKEHAHAIEAFVDRVPGVVSVVSRLHWNGRR